MAKINSKGATMIADERARQIAKEGWTSEHDDEHEQGELAQAAACYALGASRKRYSHAYFPQRWPWDDTWWKPTDPVRDLVKAGALIAAEIDRLLRAERG